MWLIRGRGRLCRSPALAGPRQQFQTGLRPADVEAQESDDEVGHSSADYEAWDAVGMSADRIGGTGSFLEDTAKQSGKKGKVLM